jgi:hypothetical protein
MKKMMLVALLGLGLVLTSGQRASAWSKVNFGVGLNLGWEGGGNSILCGLFKGAQPPMGMYGGDGPMEPEMPALPAPPLSAPVAPIAPNAPTFNGHSSAPRPMPQAMLPQRGDIQQAVGFYYSEQPQQQQTEAVSAYAPPSYWYGR